MCSSDSQKNLTENDGGKKEAGWLIPDIKPLHLRAGLYLVATPIGNLRDISLRALDVLAGADLVACEDTRVSGKLLKVYGLSKKMVSYNDHSHESVRGDLIEAAHTQIVALVSDAGMPLISDPGYKLALEACQSDVYVTSIPGANAPLMALQLSGMPSDIFSFIGFLPSKKAARIDVLNRWSQVAGSIIAFESAPRLMKALADIEHVMGQREICVARELTKMYEEMRRGTARELIEYYEQEGVPKGEIVLVISPYVERVLEYEEVEVLLREALREMRTKDAAASLVGQTGWSKKALYNLALDLAREGDN